jgi:hypothetical protein
VPRFEPRTRLGKWIADRGAGWDATPRPKPTPRLWLTLAIATIVAGALVYALLDHPAGAGVVIVAYAALVHGMTLTLHYRRWKARRGRPT